MLRYFWPSDDEQLAGQWQDSHFDEDAGWWVSTLQAGAAFAANAALTVALSTAIAISTVAQPQDDPAGSLFNQPAVQEEYWQNPTPPVNWPQPMVFTDDDVHVQFVQTFTPDDGDWRLLVQSVPASNYVQLPLSDFENFPQFPAAVNPTDDSSIWSPQFPPKDPDWTLLFFLDDGSAVPVFQPDEDLLPSSALPAPYNWPQPAQPFATPDDDFQVPEFVAAEDPIWLQLVGPVPATLQWPQPFQFEQNEPGNLVSFAQEDYWQNPTAPIADSIYLFPQWPFEQNDPAGSLTLILDDAFRPDFVRPVEATLIWPQQWAFEQNEPLGFLVAFHDEDFWTPQIPAAVWPQPSVFISDEPVPPTQSSVIDEVYARDLVAPVPSSLYQRLPYLPEPEELPAGNLSSLPSATVVVSLPGPNTVWQNPSNATLNTPGLYASVTLNKTFSAGGTFDSATTNTGTTSPATVSGAPTLASELAMLFCSAGAASGAGQPGSPGSPWTLLANPNDINSTIYTQALSSTALLSPSQSISNSQNWVQALAFFGAKTAGVTPSVVQSRTIVSGSVSAGSHSASFLSNNVAGNGILILLCGPETSNPVTAFTCSDSQGNTYNPIFSATIGFNSGNPFGTSSPTMWAIWAPNIVGGANTLTTTVTTTAFNGGSGGVSGSITAYELGGVGVIPPTANISNILQGTVFNLNVPANNQVTGLEVEVLGHQTVSNADATILVNLVLPGGASSPHRFTAQLPLSDGEVTFGSLNELWGSVLTPAVLNDPTFGVQIVASAGGGEQATFDVYSIRLQPFLSVAPPVPCFMPLPPSGPDGDTSISVFTQGLGPGNRPVLSLFCRICKSGNPLVVRGDYAIWCQDCCAFVSKQDTFMGTVQAPGQFRARF